MRVNDLPSVTPEEDTARRQDCTGVSSRANCCSAGGTGLGLVYTTFIHSLSHSNSKSLDEESHQCDLMIMSQASYVHYSTAGTHQLRKSLSPVHRDPKNIICYHQNTANINFLIF